MRLIDRTFVIFVFALLLFSTGCRVQPANSPEDPKGDEAAEDLPPEEERVEREGEADAKHMGDGRIIRPSYAPEASELRVPFWGHRGNVSEAAFNTRGDYVFTAAPNEAVVAWDVRKGFPVRQFEGSAGGRITGMAVDLDDELIAVGDTRAVQIWNVKTGKLHLRFDLPRTRRPGGAPATITALGQVYEENLVVVGDDTGRVMTIDIRDGHVERIYDTGMGSILDVVGGVEWLAVSNDDHTIVLDRRRDPVPLPLHGELKGISLWDMRATTGALLGTDGYTVVRWGPDFAKPPIAYVGPEKGIRAFTCDAVGRHAMMLTQDDKLELRILPEGKLIKQYDVAGRRPRPVLASDVWGEYMISVDTSGVMTWPFESARIERFLSNASVLRSVRFLDGSHNVIASGIDRQPVVYNVDDPLQLVRYPEIAPDPIESGVADVQSNVYYASTVGGTIAVYALREGKIVETLKLSAGHAPRLAVDDAASRLAIGTSTRDGQRPTHGEKILIWDISSNDVEAELSVGSDIVGMEFGVGSERLYYLTRSAEIETWQIDNDQRQRRFDEFNEEGRFLRLDPSGALIAVGGDEGVGFYNTRLDFLSGVSLGPVNDLAFSPDGRWAVVAAENNEVYTIYFEPDAPISVEPLYLAPSRVTSIDVSDDSQLLAIAEERGTVSFFKTNDRERTIDPHATLLLAPFKQWLVYRPNGIYHGSNEVERVLFFDVEGEIRHLLSAGVVWVRNAQMIEEINLNRPAKAAKDER